MQPTKRGVSRSRACPIHCHAGVIDLSGGRLALLLVLGAPQPDPTVLSQGTPVFDLFEGFVKQLAETVPFRLDLEEQQPAFVAF